MGLSAGVGGGADGSSEEFAGVIGSPMSAAVAGGGGMGMEAGGIAAEDTPETGVGGGALGSSDMLSRDLWSGEAHAVLSQHGQQVR